MQQQTPFTAETALAAKTVLLEVLHVFPAGATTTPVPGCNIGFTVCSTGYGLSVGGYVDDAAADEFEKTSDYFTFSDSNRGKTVFSKRIMYEESVGDMKKAVRDLIYQQLRVFMEE